ncbi:MAG: ABC transporter permease [Oscillospiraceae bacterium]|nr:ABC transporter permease [Candidatus Equicaccousia limihippi]
MKHLLFPRLAFSGMVKNKKFYLPYLLSCIGMVAMYYIIHSLSCSPLILKMPHGGDIGTILSLGKFVVAIFSLVFLFYTNSFLVKRRYNEFALYNILGMNKRNIAAIVYFESLYTAVISIAAGIFFGIAFSKLAELGLIKMARSSVDYAISVPPEALFYTVLIFIPIFLLLMLKSVIVIAKSKPIELMQSASYGEKPVKANYVFAVLGIIILGAAYYMSVTISDPLSALMLFFVAVILVIDATYLLFISGSVALCKVLQKNKKYYYRKNHFVSVSSMSYRMKRNGAGLASICILCTMVLVMISSTSSLYFGADNAIKSRYPRDCEINISLKSVANMSDGTISEIRDCYENSFKQNKFVPKNVCEYRYASTTGMLSNDTLNLTPDYDNYTMDYSNLRAVYFVSAEDFNRAMGTDYALINNQAMLYTLRCDYNGNSLKVGNIRFNVVKKLDKFVTIGEAGTLVMPSFLMVVPDYNMLLPLNTFDTNGESMLSLRYYYGYDTALDDAQTVKIYSDQNKAIQNSPLYGNAVIRNSGGCVAGEKDDFYATFGGLFFLGIILSVVFIFAAAVIIYYKQVSEGYEDRKRFEIMQNVGMSDKDIKKAINSQILTVFFAPLIMSGLHLAFAFPFIWKILQMFNLQNIGYVITVTVAAFVLFAAFYALVYKITAKSYYNIVAAKKE